MFLFTSAYRDIEQIYKEKKQYIHSRFYSALDTRAGGTPIGGGTPGGNIAGGGRRVINAVIAAGLGGIPGERLNPHEGTIAGMPGRGGTIFGFIIRGGIIGKGVAPSFPDLYAAVV